MTTGRINQVASALPRASLPAGRAPTRGAAWRRATPAPHSALPAAGRRRAAPPRRPSGREPPGPTEFPGASRGADGVAGASPARPRPGGLRGGRLTEPPSARTAAPPAAPGARPAAIGPRNPSFADGADDAAPPLGDPRPGRSGGIARAPPAAAWAAGGARAPQQETALSGGMGRPALAPGGRCAPPPDAVRGAGSDLPRGYGPAARGSAATAQRRPGTSGRGRRPRAEAPTRRGRRASGATCAMPHRCRA